LGQIDVRGADLFRRRNVTMNDLIARFSRRSFLRGAAATAAAASATAFFTTPGAFAQELVRTPAQTEGPFYPDRLPLDTDNDLLIINDNITPAVGDVTHLSGRILDSHGDPVRNATVEIWQVDNRGNYLHTRGANPERGNQRDTNFQGFGRFLTASSGEYYFRTIKPVPYPGRTPHIHVKVKIRGRQEFITQCYVRGEARNQNDGILQGIRDERQRNSVIIEFAALPNSRANELQARFDIVLGFTPGEAGGDERDEKKGKDQKKKKG
jgi:protocatechuate 3,4-dioxygenase beta subunit